MRMCVGVGVRACVSSGWWCVAAFVGGGGDDIRLTNIAPPSRTNRSPRAPLGAAVDPNRLKGRRAAERSHLRPALLPRARTLSTKRVPTKSRGTDDRRCCRVVGVRSDQLLPVPIVCRHRCVVVNCGSCAVVAATIGSEDEEANRTMSVCARSETLYAARREVASKRPAWLSAALRHVCSTHL